jgi:L-cysteine S-thiosulfotransferase
MRRAVAICLFASLAAAPALAGSGKATVEVPPDEVVFVNDITVPEPLTDKRGKPFQGLETFVDRSLGNCLACHINFDVQAMQFLGDVGPNLNWVGERYTREELRAIVIDPKRVFGEGTLMPSFYVAKAGERVREEYVGKPILTAQQVEDVVAYLASLRR